MEELILNNGEKIPFVGLGTWKLQGDVCRQMVKKAYELGYRHFDTAFIYENEKEVGSGLEGAKRDSYFLTSKLWRDFHHPKKVEPSCDQSLKDLKTDYLDLYLLHWPERENHFCDIVYALTRLQERGKVKSIGVSNATEKHLGDLEQNGLKIQMNQIEIHPFFNQEAFVRFCQEKGIAVTAYSPLARGDVEKDETLQRIGRKYQKSASQIALRSLIERGIVAIPKASSEKHLASNLSLFDFSLSDEEKKEISQIPQKGRLIAPFWNEFEEI